ncbi:MAG: CPBP family intramembrane glutamic endopeptidase [Chloroflexota bacterium]
MIWIFAALLVGWGNAAPPLIGATARLPGGSWAFGAAGATITIVSAVVAWRAGLDASAMGLRPSGWLRGAALGAVAGAAIAVVGVAGLQLASLVVGGPVVYDPLRGVTGADFTRHLLIFLPLGTVLPEEIAFRGTLVGLLRKSGARAALLGSAVAFSLWHAAVAVFTVNDTTVALTPWYAPAIGGALAVVFAGGLVLAWLRLRTKTLATTIAAHWSFNATLLVGLWSTLPAPVPHA